MKFFKKAIALLLSAICVCFGTGGFALGAFTETSDSASYGIAEYIPAESSDYKRWTGSSNFKENQNYYIDRTVKITKEKTFTLPKNSKLLIKDKGSLVIYSGSTLNIKGELIVEPTATVIVSGELNTLENSAVNNYGTFSATKSSSLNISSVFTTGSKGITAISGKMNVYRAGAIVNHNRFTFGKNSDVTLSGKAICEKNGVMFIKGALVVTMNGSVKSNGSLYIYGRMVVSGTVTLAPNSKLHKENGRLSLSKSGQLFDDRNKTSLQGDFVDMTNRIEYPELSEYDSEPADVNWLGIDVSRYQGAIDWEKVKASGVDVVILRSSIGDGSDNITGEDIRFSYNVVEAKKAGLMVGAYHYLWAETPEDARKEAQFFIRTISPYILDFPAVLDFEDPSQQENLTNAERTEIAKVFLEEVRKAGYYPMLYTNRSWATTYLNMDELSDYDVWLAEWFPQTSYTGDYGIWQYTAYGKVSGIDTDVDLNICYKNYRKIILNGGYNHLK